MRHLRAGLTKVGAIALVMGLVGCQYPPAPLFTATSPTRTTTSTAAAHGISGRVLGLDGQPAAGVLVHAFPLISNNAGSLISNNAGSLISNNAGSLISNNAGSYRLQDANTLEVRTGADGRFALDTVSSSLFNVEAVLSDDVKAIVQQVPSDAGKVDMQLAFTGTLTGHVTAPGRPAVTDFTGVDVYVPGTSYLAKAAASGVYTIDHVAVGTFAMVASKAGLGTANLNAVAVRAKETTQAPDLALSLDAPTIGDVTPGAATVGQEVVIKGDRFKTSQGETLEVNFGGVPATVVQAIDDHTLKATVPVGASTGNLSVKVGGVMSNAVAFGVVTSIEVGPGPLTLAVGDTPAFPIRFLGGSLPVLGATGDIRIEGPVYVDLAAGEIGATDGGTASIIVTSGTLPPASRAILALKRWPTVRTLAGSYNDGSAALVDGTGDAVGIDEPYDVALWGDTVIFSDRANRALRTISPTGTVQTWLAKSGGTYGADLNPTMGMPERLAVDPANGDIYYTETSSNRIRKVSAGGVVTTLCDNGPGYENGPLSVARFQAPEGLALGPDGTLYVADPGNDCIRAISRDGTVWTVAGSPGQPGFRDGNGPQARFNSPEGLVADGQGNLYVSELENHAVRRITPDGTVTTFAGDGTGGDDNGRGSKARFFSPCGMAWFGAYLLVADRADASDGHGNRIRLITPSGDVFSFAGTGRDDDTDPRDVAANKAVFQGPCGLAVGPDGTIYVAEEYGNVIRQIIP